MSQQRPQKEGLLERPPIVVVLGHVDHGKTTLLDKLRQTRVAEREPGGITQSIGAYQVNFRGKRITFIDTPGHQAFSKMRARGGQVADLAVLVVAVDDGVMPQTLESVEHIKAAGIPFLVALNKIDLPGVESEKVKKQLSENGILVEGYGGQVVCVPISAKTGQGLEELLEMIVLLAQMQEIKADPDGPLEAIIIESKKSKGGWLGTVVVRNGTLKVGDLVLAGQALAKIKSLINENGQKVNQALPGTPVEVLGFEASPPVGVKLTRSETLSPPALPQPLPFLRLPEGEEKKLKIILKADSTGSLEALAANLGPAVFLVSSGVGDVSESDVFLAQTTQAKIFAFRVRLPSSVAKLAENEKVGIRTGKVIYQFLEDLEKEVLLTLTPKVEEEVLGKAEIIAEFTLEGQRIAGCRVTEGKISQTDELRLARDSRVLGQTKISSMKRKTERITEAKLKEEFGVIFTPPLDFKIGDVLISFKPKGE